MVLTTVDCAMALVGSSAGAANVNITFFMKIVAGGCGKQEPANGDMVPQTSFEDPPCMAELSSARPVRQVLKGVGAPEHKFVHVGFADVIV